MLRKQNRYALRDSPSNSTQPSYQSTCASPPHVYDCGTKVSSPSNPIAAFLWRTYWRTVDSATATSGISRRSRIHIRCAVCRCFLGALRSASRTASINGIAAASLGRSRSGIFRSGGIALASALRTSRRCTPSFRATARIVPPHVRTLAESARIAPLSLSCFPKSRLLPGSKTRNNIHDSCFTGGAKSEHRKGPIQSIEIKWTDWADPSPYNSLDLPPRRLDADSLFELATLLEQLTNPKQKD